MLVINGTTCQAHLSLYFLELEGVLHLHIGNVTGEFRDNTTRHVSFLLRHLFYAQYYLHL